MATDESGAAQRGIGGKCKFCREALREGATRCPACGSFQNWRRHLTLSATVLSLLVALVSVSALALPVFVDAFEPRRSRVSVELSFWSGDYAYLYFTNDGSRPALVESIDLHLGTFHVRFPPHKLTADETVEQRLVRERTTEIYRIDRRAPEDNSLKVSIHPIELEALDWLDDWSVDSAEAALSIIAGMKPFIPSDPPAVRPDAETTSEDPDEFYDPHNDLRNMLWRLQFIAADLTYEDIRDLDCERLFGFRSFDDVQRWAASIPSVYEDQTTTLTAYAEAVRILECLDEFCAEEKAALEVVVRHSNGEREVFSFQPAYLDVARFARPLVLGRTDVDPDLLVLLSPQQSRE